MVEPVAPTFYPGSAAGDNRSEPEGLFGGLPIWNLMDLDCRSEFSKLVSIFITCRSKVVPFMFGHLSRVFAEPRTKFSTQHALKGAGLYLGDELVIGRVADVLLNASHRIMNPF